MPPMRKVALARLKFPFSNTERSRNECATSLSKRLNVNEEYKEAFRTKSYEDMWSKINGQLRRKSIDRIDRVSSPSSISFYGHLSDYLFEPEQLHNSTEKLATEKSKSLLDDYLEASSEACKLCDSLLQNIYQTRVDNQRLERVIKLSRKLKDSQDDIDNVRGAIFKDLSAFALVRNPFSLVGPQFGNVHDNNMVLLHRLSSEQSKIRRKVKLNRICKKAGGCFLLISHTAIIIGLLVIALHSIIGIVIAPGLVGCSVYLFRKKIKFADGGFKMSSLEKRYAQFDTAARGIYILINDFNTISRLVRSLYEEIEHKKALAGMCVRNKNVDLLKKVVKEFYMHDRCYQEQLDELEEHMYLCFHTINKSIRLVIPEISQQ